MVSMLGCPRLTSEKINPVTGAENVIVCSVSVPVIAISAPSVGAFVTVALVYVEVGWK
jgi:hypothetical protein